MSDGLYNQYNERTRPGRQVAASSSTLVNRNVTVDGHRTSIRLEPVMWDALRDVCARERVTVNTLVTMIAKTSQESSLTAAIRVRLVTYYHEAATEDGHRGAGHGRANGFGEVATGHRPRGDHPAAPVLQPPA